MELSKKGNNPINPKPYPTKSNIYIIIAIFFPTILMAQRRYLYLPQPLLSFSIYGLLYHYEILKTQSLIPLKSRL